MTTIAVAKCPECRARTTVQAAVQSARGAADLALAVEIAETPLVTLEALNHLLAASESGDEWRKSLAFALVASFDGDEQKVTDFVRAATLAFGLVAAMATEEKGAGPETVG